MNRKEPGPFHYAKLHFNACEKNTLPTVWADLRELQVLDSPGGVEGKFPTDICIECKIYN